MRVHRQYGKKTGNYSMEVMLQAAERRFQDVQDEEDEKK
jgi:hypothetical protein